VSAVIATDEQLKKKTQQSLKKNKPMTNPQNKGKIPLQPTPTLAEPAGFHKRCRCLDALRGPHSS